MKHMQTKLTTKSKKGSHIHNQSPILAGCSRFQNTASLRFSPESRRTCFSCRLGDVGILKRSFFEGRLRHMCTVPYTEQQRQQPKKTVTKTMTTCTYCYYSCYNNGDYAPKKGRKFSHRFLHKTQSTNQMSRWMIQVFTSFKPKKTKGCFFRPTPSAHKTYQLS